MTIRRFPYCLTLYFITTCLFNLINTNAKEVISFQTTGGTIIPQSKGTIDVNSASLIECALECLSSRKCCAASFCRETSTCRIDTSEKCCLYTEIIDGWSTVQQNTYLPLTSTRSISFGNSMYSIFEKDAKWEKANESCKCLGGKLLELEPSEENEFIKNDVKTVNTGVKGYWIGGYNFNNDGDLEWLRKPNQVMPFNDWYLRQPNSPVTEPCMLIWRNFSMG